MAFGKNPSNLGRAGTFRQQSAAFIKNNFNKGKKGGVPYFVDQYKPTASVDTIRLLLGHFAQEQMQGEPPNQQLVTVDMPMVKIVDHYDGRMKKSAICSAKPWADINEAKQTCHGCAIFWDTAVRQPQGGMKSERMGKQNKFAFAIYDYSSYHKVEQVDRDTGRTKTNSRTGEPYFNWVKCTNERAQPNMPAPPMTCEMCRAGKEIKYGHSSHWCMTYTEFQILRAAEWDIGASCARCQQPNSIRSLAWCCNSCGNAVIDMQSSSFKVEELMKMVEGPMQCGHCKNVDLLSEVFECGVCSQRGQQGQRATLFDVDLELRYITVGDKKILQVVKWSVPYMPDPNTWKDIDKPVDLLKKYQPDSLEVQADRFGIIQSGPMGGATPGQQPMHYPQQPHIGQQPMPGPQPQMQPQYPAPQPGVPAQQAFQPPFPQQQQPQAPAPQQGPAPAPGLPGVPAGPFVPVPLARPYGQR